MEVLKNDQIEIITKIFSEIGKEGDNIKNSKLNDLLKSLDENNKSLTAILKGSLDQLENAYQIIIRNTDTKTFKVNDAVFQYVNKDEVINQLHRISFLGRRIERELKEYYESAKNEVG